MSHHAEHATETLSEAGQTLTQSLQARAGTGMTEAEQMMAFMASGLLFMWGLRRGGLFPSLALAGAGALASAGMKRRWPSSVAGMLSDGSMNRHPRLSATTPAPTSTI